MSFATILVIIMPTIIAMALIAGLILIFLILKTIRDIQKIIEVVGDVSMNIKNKNFSEVMNNPMIREKVIVLISSRFGIFAPIVEIIITEVLSRRAKNNVVK